MSEISLKQQLANLAKLQVVDTEIYHLRKEKDALPEKIKALEEAFNQKKAILAEIEKKSLDLQKQKKERELELGSKEEGGKKLQSQLYSLKTNKEYQAMLQQIADGKADASMIEDKILEIMDGVDKAKVELEEAKKRIGEEEQIFNQEKAKIGVRVKEIDDRLSQLDGQRKQASEGMDVKILAQYDRILASRDGLAITTVKDYSCQGCNMSVPAQVINLIKMYERIITCEVCNRMLYVED